MATLLRFARPCKQYFKHYVRCRPHLNQCRFITTSDKSKDIVSAGSGTLVEKSQELRDLEEHFGDADESKLKNWQPYGWDTTDRDNDAWHMNIFNFYFITFLIVGCGFLIGYAPDLKKRDWVMREAYLELDRREKAGLPLIDPYFLPPESINLPTEEELSDQEIII